MAKRVLSKEVKRVDTNLKTNKKAPTKSELEIQVKLLKQANDALEEKNKKNIEIIESFEEKMINLENQIDFLSYKDTVSSKETQTDTDANLKCEECNFEGVSERELGWHMGKHHGWPSDEQTEDMDISRESQGVRYCVICDYEAEDFYDLEAHTWSEHEEVEKVDHARRTLKDKENDTESVKCVNIHQNPHQNDSMMGCKFCGENFETLSSLMKHKKRVHTEKVALCWNFSSGKCEFSDDSCWFSHSKDLKVMDNFKCNICQHIFKTKSEVHYHQKREHVRSNPYCNKRKCTYGAEKCWFQHTENEQQEDNLNKNCEITSKLFGMMETFTNRIINLEKQMEMTSQ